MSADGEDWQRVALQLAERLAQCSIADRRKIRSYLLRFSEYEIADPIQPTVVRNDFSLMAV